MTRFPEADNRLFINMFVCMKCNKKNRGSPGKKPIVCRNCGSKRLRLKHKTKKS